MIKKLIVPDSVGSILDSVDKMQLSVERMVIACKMEDGTVQTAYYNTNFIQKQELISHMQIDVVDQMIEANIGKYIEIIEE